MSRIFIEFFFGEAAADQRQQKKQRIRLYYCAARVLFDQIISGEHVSAMNQEKFELEYSRRSPQAEKLCDTAKVKSKLLPRNILKSVLSFFPILQWLERYNWKKDLHGDIIGGLTVGIMHVPQGMAYASLASLPPVYGMYSSFFTSTLYMFFGTSRHISIGVFAVASLMVGAVRLRYVPDPDVVYEMVNGTEMEVVKQVASPVKFGYEVTPIMLTSALTMVVGLFQIAMAVMKLSFLTTYMSDALISGFTTGSAFHVFTAQLNKIIGVKLPRYSGFGMLFFMMRDLFFALPQTNYFTLGISIFSIVFLSIGRDYVNPWFKKRSPVPLPLELILVILLTIFSVIMDLKKNYHVKIVDYIPQGVPEPSLPKFDLMPYLLNDAFAIAVISYMFVISMAKLFAKKRHYKIDPGQEMYAVGLMHTLSSFFPVFPAGASLSRSAVCEQSGANTQLYTLFSSALLLTVIAFIGPMLEPLPMCVLACIVVVSLKSLFMQYRELWKLWKISKYDFAVWLVSCVATMSSDVITGLSISVAFTLVSVVIREQWPKIFLMGRTQNHEIYKPLIYYEALKNVGENVRIIRFEAPLTFINVAAFLDKMDGVLKVDDNSDKELQVLKKSKKEANTRPNYEELSQKEEVVVVEDSKSQVKGETSFTQVVVVDCGAITSIDTMGVEAFREVYVEGTKLNKEVLFAHISETVLDIFERIDFYSSVPKSSFYPSVEEAVLAATDVKIRPSS